MGVISSFRFRQNIELCFVQGATVGCAEVSCKKSYHLNCGAGADSLLQYFGQFKSLCSRHRQAEYIATIPNIKDMNFERKKAG